MKPRSSVSQYFTAFFEHMEERIFAKLRPQSLELDAKNPKFVKLNLLPECYTLFFQIVAEIPSSTNMGEVSYNDQERAEPDLAPCWPWV